MIFKRLLAFIIDLFIIAIIVNLLLVVVEIICSKQSVFLMLFFSSLMVTLLLCKDCFNGQSLGKRIMKIQLVDVKKGTEVSNIRCVVRNLLIPFWIVEIFVLVVSNGRRIGDYITKTKIINKSSSEKIRIDKKTLVFGLFCFCVNLLFLFLLFNIFHFSMFQLLF